MCSYCSRRSWSFVSLVKPRNFSYFAPAKNFPICVTFTHNPRSFLPSYLGSPFPIHCSLAIFDFRLQHFNISPTKSNANFQSRTEICLDISTPSILNRRWPRLIIQLYSFRQPIPLTQHHLHSSLPKSTATSYPAISKNPGDTSPFHPIISLNVHIINFSRLHLLSILHTTPSRAEHIFTSRLPPQRRRHPQRTTSQSRTQQT
jgi:hypothetical protein